MTQASITIKKTLFIVKCDLFLYVENNSELLYASLSITGV